MMQIDACFVMAVLHAACSRLAQRGLFDAMFYRSLILLLHWFFIGNLNIVNRLHDTSVHGVSKYVEPTPKILSQVANRACIK